MPVLAVSTDSTVHIWDPYDMSNTENSFNASEANTSGSPSISYNLNNKNNNSSRTLPLPNFKQNLFSFDPFFDVPFPTSISSAAWLENSPDLAIGGSLNSIKIFNAQTATCLDVKTKFSISGVIYDKLDRNGLIVSSSESTALHKYNIRSSSWSVLYETRLPIYSVTSNFYNDFIASAGFVDGVVQLFENTLTKSSFSSEFKNAHSAPISEMKFNMSDNKSLFSVGLDGYILHYDTKSRRPQLLYKSASGINTFELDNHYGLFTGNIFGKVSFFDIRQMSHSIWSYPVDSNSKITCLALNAHINQNLLPDKYSKIKRNLNASQKLNQIRDSINNQVSALEFENLLSPAVTPGIYSENNVIDTPSFQRSIKPKYYQTNTPKSIASVADQEIYNDLSSNQDYGESNLMDFITPINKKKRRQPKSRDNLPTLNIKTPATNLVSRLSIISRTPMSKLKLNSTFTRRNSILSSARKPLLSKNSPEFPTIENRISNSNRGSPLLLQERDSDGKYVTFENGNHDKIDDLFANTSPKNRRVSFSFNEKPPEKLQLKNSDTALIEKPPIPPHPNNLDFGATKIQDDNIPLSSLEKTLKNESIVTRQGNRVSDRISYFNNVTSNIQAEAEGLKKPERKKRKGDTLHSFKYISNASSIEVSSNNNNPNCPDHPIRSPLHVQEQKTVNINIGDDIRSSVLPQEKFLSDLVTSKLRDVLSKAMDDVNQKIQAVHLDVLKQGYMIQDQISQMKKEALEKDSLIRELTALKRENEWLKSYMPKDFLFSAGNTTKKN
ncbi:hypothetical protein BB560_003840 [Smittium megazygosporum]|uniref:WD40 repeat-like protein n=1 Tax=Smittium megazygosporum TaxID=133381 RepID=A0A2T9ZAV6_9FUNG|nr:hypothetical protein BB560_003840 [Smittium megazygosporum]